MSKNTKSYMVVVYSNTLKTWLTCPLNDFGGDMVTAIRDLAEARAISNKNKNPDCGYFVVEFVGEAVPVVSPKYEMRRYGSV